MYILELKNYEKETEELLMQASLIELYILLNYKFSDIFRANMIE